MIKKSRKAMGSINVKSTEMSREAAAAVRPKNVLEAFESIVELAQDSQLNDEFMERSGTLLAYAARKLKLTPLQTAILAIFVDRCEDRRIMLSEIAGFLGCRTTRMLRFSREVDVLEKRHFLRARRDSDSTTYRVTKEAIAAIKENRPFVIEPRQIASTQDFFDGFNELFHEHDENELPYDELITSSTELLEQITDTHFYRELKRRFVVSDSDYDMWLFIFMAHLFVENNDDRIRFSDIEDLYDNDRIPTSIKNELRQHDSRLFTLNLIECTNENGMVNASEWKLTDFAKEEILAELNLKVAGRNDSDLIKHDTLAAKRLIYNDSEQAQIKELTDILKPERFAQVQERLEKAGMRKGFCCLFYGAPGTGKTETVYQIARATGRDIMKVDVDKIKSCWVGESEKNIKKLFDTYRAKCKVAAVAPILLFNEADAVLGIRLEGAGKAVDKMENSIQNIILQEMESLDGIMIATTNLTTNLDKAFERRFLYKVRYERPTAAARADIWQTMLQGLSAEMAKALAEKFDLSGGEIENIVRKHTVSAILSGREIIDLDTIAATCRCERISNSKKAVGF